MQDFSHAFKARLNALHREWQRRLYSLRRFCPLKEDFPLQPGPFSAPSRILLAGMPGPDLLQAMRALEPDNVTVLNAATPGEAARALDRAACDSMVISAGQRTGEFIPLLAAMKAHPERQSLPVLVIAGPDGNLDRLGIQSAERPAPERVVRWIGDGLLHRRLGRALTEAFAAFEPAVAHHPPGVFSSAFARVHLETLLTSPHAVLTTLAQIELTSSGLDGKGRGGAADLPGLAGRRLAGLVPAEVMVSDAPSGGLWLLFPETGSPAAAEVLERASQSLRARPVTVGGSATPVHLFPRFHTLTAGPGDNVLAFVRRCRNVRFDAPAPVVH